MTERTARTDRGRMTTTSRTGADGQRTDDDESDDWTDRGQRTDDDRVGDGTDGWT
jgi:hypothetical protein